MFTDAFSRIGRILTWTLVVVLAIGVYMAYGAFRLRKADKAFHDELIDELPISSRTVAHGGNLPIRCTCDGGDTHPSIKPDSVPEGTHSFVLTMTEESTPFSWMPLVFYTHWTAINLPANLDLAEGGPLEVPAGASMLTNSYGRPGYTGPCATFLKRKYRIRLYALAVPTMHLNTDISYTDLLDAMKGKVLQYGEMEVGVE